MRGTLGLRFGHARDLEHKQRAQATIFREGQERIRSGSKGYRSAATIVALITMRAKIWKAVQNLYAVGILVYFAAPALSESRYPIFLIGLPSWAATPFRQCHGNGGPAG